MKIDAKPSRTAYPVPAPSSSQRIGKALVHRIVIDTPTDEAIKSAINTMRFQLHATERAIFDNAINTVRQCSETIAKPEGAPTNIIMMRVMNDASFEDILAMEKECRAKCFVQ